MKYNKNLGKPIKTETLIDLYLGLYHKTYIELDPFEPLFNQNSVEANISTFIEKCMGFAVLNTLKKWVLKKSYYLAE